MLNALSKISARKFLFYGGISRSEFESIRPMLWQRNLDSLQITASLAAGIGTVFLLINAVQHSGNQTPYLVLLCGSVLILCLLPPVRRKSSEDEIWSLLLCYGQMMLICGYAIFLSTQKANYDIPATSAIVFIAVLPLSIDDRPIRMFTFMLGESILYLLFSHSMKSPHAFFLDLMNTVTFCIVGMVLYAVMCTRNIRELFQSVRIEEMSFQTIQTLANAIDAKDPYTKGHSTRVSQYSVKIAEALGWKKERIDALRCAALLHDIGKIGVPDSILNNPARLTDVEFDIIKSHTTIGGDILREHMIVDIAEDVACSHHERYDGKGYPRGLKGKEISEEARIVCIADAFDAMNSNRVYRKACTRDYILQQLKDGRGKQFDPEYTDILIELWDRGELEDSLKSIPGWKERSETFELSVQEALETFITENNDIEMLFTEIRNSGSYEGALNVEYSQFTKLYEFISNLEKRFSNPFKLVLISLNKNPTEDSQPGNLRKAMFYMDRAIRINIRDVDIVTQYNQQQFLIILIGTDPAGVKTALDRIFKSYYRMNGSNAFMPSYAIVDTAEKELPSDPKVGSAS